jgi:tRNA threonylcarbamoyladenosine biosynthesis protein TsaE
VRSPTFVVMKAYKISNLKSKISAKAKSQNFKNLIHIDAYRLKTGEDLKMLGWEEIIKNPRNIVLIEWPENVKEAMPEKYVKMEFEHNGEDVRNIKMQI